jgi:hypothetical protein
MTEYWLQKKTLGGWSHVTWYADLEQAQENYGRCLLNKGYSWRLIKAETVVEHLLDETTEIEPPAIEEPKQTGWGSSFNWGKSPDNETTTLNKPDHGMTGKVWVINHKTKERKRVDPEVADQLGSDWERGGPKTAFREG